MAKSTLPAQMRGAPGIIRLHGHRGARGMLPENTLIGFRHCFDIGLQVVEVDIMVTADGVPVLTHNPRLMAAATRGPDGKWLQQDSALVARMPLAELQRFDVGGLRDATPYAARYPDQAFLSDVKIPTLAQLSDMMQAPDYADTWLNIEIKSDPAQPECTPPLAELIASVLAVIRTANLTKRVLLQSFDWRVLGEIARQAPDLPRSYLTYAPRTEPTMQVNVTEGSPWMDGVSLAAFSGSIPRIVLHLGGVVWSPFHQDITAETLAEARALGLVVNAWTVNERADIDRMIDLGVDGIITDYPSRVQRRLMAKNFTWR